MIKNMSDTTYTPEPSEKPYNLPKWAAILLIFSRICTKPIFIIPCLIFLVVIRFEVESNWEAFLGCLLFAHSWLWILYFHFLTRISDVDLKKYLETIAQGTGFGRWLIEKVNSKEY